MHLNQYYVLPKRALYSAERLISYFIFFIKFGNAVSSTIRRKCLLVSAISFHDTLCEQFSSLSYSLLLRCTRFPCWRKKAKSIKTLRQMYVALRADFLDTLSKVDARDNTRCDRVSGIYFWIRRDNYVTPKYFSKGFSSCILQFRPSGTALLLMMCVYPARPGGDCFIARSEDGWNLKGKTADLPLETDQRLIFVCGKKWRTVVKFYLSSFSAHLKMKEETPPRTDKMNLHSTSDKNLTRKTFAKPASALIA